MEKRRFGRGLGVLVVAVSLFFSVKVAAADWWKPTSEVDKDKTWHYRIPIMLTTSGKLDYTSYPIEVGVDFNQALKNLNKSSESLDLPNSLRLITSEGKEVPCQYDDTLYKGKDDDTKNGKGTVVFILDNLKSGAYRKYFLYFDTLEAGGIKRKSEYPSIKAMKGEKGGQIDTGKIEVSLAYGGGSYHSGVKRLKIKSPEGDIGIPMYGYGIGRIGLISAPFEVNYVKGPVFAKYILTNTMNNPYGGIRKPDDKKFRGKPENYIFKNNETKTVKVTFTFFNNSSIWYRDSGGSANYMGGGFFTTYQDSSMESPGSLEELAKDKGYIRHSARYGIASSKDGYSLATCVWDKAWEGKSKEAMKATFAWRTKTYLTLPSVFGISQQSRIKHNLAKGGMEIARILDELPTVICNPNKVEKR